MFGPVAIGLGIWCAAGHVTVASSGSASVRLAATAPWWVFAAGVAAAALVPVWRRTPSTALPVLLSTVPWWPVPLPAIALIWTGPLAWLPVAAAVMAGPAGQVVAACGRRAAGWRPGPATGLAAVATLCATLVTAWAVAPRLPGGDEPHYLVITQSLLADGDLRIENNHAARDYAAYYGGDLAPDYIERGRDGEIYSIHAPGLSALIAPAFRLFGYRGAQAVVILLAGITGALVWRVGWEASGDAGAAWFGWAAVTGSATCLMQSVTIFPDGPAALAVIAACWLLVRLDHGRVDSVSGSAPGRAALVAVGGLLAVLPWLHTRFVVLAAGFGLAAAWALLREPQPNGRTRVSRILWFLGVPAASAIAWFAFFMVVYGTPSPTAPYGPNPEASWAFVPGGVSGLLWDQQFGLLATSPVIALAVLGLAAGRASAARRCAVAIALVYVAVVATYWMWWAGRPATPARFAAAALPALVLPLVGAWSRLAAGGRAVWLAVLGASLALGATLVSVGRGGLTWNDRTGNAAWLDWAGPVVDLPRGWPSFFWTLDPARLASEWPFVAHVAVTLVLLVGSAWGLVSFGRSFMSDPGPARRSTAWWGLLVLMVVVQSGWWLNGVDGLDPIRSQLSLVSLESRGEGLKRIAPRSYARASVVNDLMMKPERTGRLDVSGSLGGLAGVPAARYDVTFEGASGPVDARLGRMAEPWVVFNPEPGETATMVLDLPAGARQITFNPDPTRTPASGGTPEVRVRPVALYPPTPTGAVSAARFDGMVVFFLDDSVFVESGGFWVRGNRTAAFLVSRTSTGAGASLELRNGAVSNDVTFDVAGERHTSRLEPSAVEVNSLPGGIGGSVLLSVTSATGFRPSDSDGGIDTRFLGVWIRLVRDQAREP